MGDVFTHKSILPDCSFKSNQRTAKFFRIFCNSVVSFTVSLEILSEIETEFENILIS